MSTPVLATKLYIPPLRSKIVLRPRLVERLNESLSQPQGGGSKLTLISAAAGFGKTTLVSEWVAHSQRGEAPVHAAWLSLDEGDGDPTRFLAYLIAAIQTIVPQAIGEGVLAALQSPQPPSVDSLLTALLNEMATLPDRLVLILDDYHVVDSQAVDQALAFLIEHLPPQMRLIIATREDPRLPLARWRARGQLTELRAADLRFTPAEAADFLNRVMGLGLSVEDIAALENRTEGWIAGLQLAALALQGTLSTSGPADAAGFIQSFTGSHRFVLDYLIEEVLQQQPEAIQTFLLSTAILERLCGPLCDAVLENAAAASQKTLEYLEHANLFIIPLDNERRWYRYHHLFAELLRQRLGQAFALTGSAGRGVAELHIRASQWYEENGLYLEAFQHAVAAQDVERAAHLVESEAMPLNYGGAVAPVLAWLATLPRSYLDTRPVLWAKFATLSLVAGITSGVAERLQAAETALLRAEPAARQDSQLNERIRNFLGQMAAARATLALTQYQADTMIEQAQRALAYLPASNLSFRTTAYWVLGFAYFLKGNRGAARQVQTEGAALSEASGDLFSMTLSTSGLGLIQEVDNQLYAAAETYRRCLQLFGDPTLPHACEPHLGLAHIYYEWNDLEAAEYHAQQSLYFAHQYERIIDRFVISVVFLARLKLTRGDVDGAAALLAQTDEAVRQNNYVFRKPEVAAAQVDVLLRQGNISAATQLAQQYALPLSQARVHLAQGDPSAALAVLVPYREQAESMGWADERLKAMVLQSLAEQALGETDQALQVLDDALALAEPGGFIRLFVDEGLPMARLLSEAAARGVMPDYVSRLLVAFGIEAQASQAKPASPPGEPQAQSDKTLLVDPLSRRELEVLQLIAQGLSNQAISERLFLALDTVKGHNRRIFDKLQVERRTEAVARARELGLL